MDTLFLEARYNGKVDLDKVKLDKLPGNIGLITTVQFVAYLGKIKNFLVKPSSRNFQKKNKKVLIENGRQKYPGQILGCDISSAERIKDRVDAFLYVGTGKFHPLVVGVKTGKDVFSFNPITNEFRKIDSKEIDAYKKKKKGSLLKFLSEENVGVLISTKPGQYYDIKRIDDLIKRLKRKYADKNFYIFITETIDYTQLENFPFIKAWVNTACPRIEDDIRIVNIGEIK